MLIQTLSLTCAASSVQNRCPNNKSLANQSIMVFDPRVRHVAWQALTYGEYLSWARCAKYTPCSPDTLKNKTVCWIGDSCRLVKSGFEIKTRIDGILSGGTSHESKVNEMMEAVQLALDVANTCFVDRLPIKTSRYAGYSLLTAAKAGAVFANSVNS